MYTVEDETFVEARAIVSPLARELSELFPRMRRADRS